MTTLTAVVQRMSREAAPGGQFLVSYQRRERSKHTRKGQWHDEVVDASNIIRLGNAEVTVIEGEVGFTASSDRNKKENFQPVKGDEVLLGFED